MSNTLDLLTAELSELFNRVDSILKTIEASYSSDACFHCIRTLPAPSLQALLNVLPKISNPTPTKPTSTPNRTEISVSSDHHKTTVPPTDEYPHSDGDLEIRDCEPSNNTSNPDPRVGLYDPDAISISDDLCKALIENREDPQYFLHSTCHGAEASDGVVGAFSQLHRNFQRIQSDTTRDIYLQFYCLYRRLELRNIFLLAREFGYHTGRKWCRNACEDLTSKIKARHPTLPVKTLLNEYVQLGYGYNKWAEELGGPEFLLMLPSTVSEAQDTSRRYLSFFIPAVNSLRENGIERILKDKNLDLVGKALSENLWALSLGRDGSLKRTLTKLARRSKRKRQIERNSKCPGVRFTSFIHVHMGQMTNIKHRDANWNKMRQAQLEQHSMIVYDGIKKLMCLMRLYPSHPYKLLGTIPNFPSCWIW
ncbi:hypothetical protein PDIG_90750 [Penicillium digitatum PHI26]|uniref:Uncharacterized protein n=1 Tax=Penicillium digitatum (strain PHI26 / CECT 20796) TaxID=1170229 RepID=K9FSZ9_PEND2|nr:hypothetical protein PDIG_90750 [Penicillium digitatum PHI26]